MHAYINVLRNVSIRVLALSADGRDGVRNLRSIQYYGRCLQFRRPTLWYSFAESVRFFFLLPVLTRGVYGSMCVI